MARRKKTRRKSASTAIVLRQEAPMRKRARRRPGRVIMGRVQRAKTVARRSGGRLVGQLVDTGIAAGAGALVAWSLQNEKIPTRIAGVETTFALGAALSLVPVLVRGKIGRVVGDAGTAVAAIAAYKLTLGTELYVKDKSGWDGGDSGY